MLTLLGTGHDWRTEGARVRSALVDALAPRSRGRGADTAHASGPATPWRRPPGRSPTVPWGPSLQPRGALVVHSVRDGVVEIAMEGACDHCPAAEITMHARFEHLLRRRCPWLVEVRRIDE